MNKWFENPSKDGDVVISSRVRLARNFKKYPFPSENFPESEDVINTTRNSLSSLNFEYLSMKDADEITRSSMVARHLISPPFSKNSSGGILYSPDESVSVMINEEDHLRIQVLLSGNNLTECYSLAEIIDDKISETNEYAFSERLGYLTKCPTNLGTGLRASLMLHLPVLERSGALSTITDSVSKIGLTVRGMYGEKSRSRAALYQLSNQVTLGISEQAAIDNLSAIANQIVQKELATREGLDKLVLQDSVYRALGTLRYARLLSSEEMMNLISEVKLGVEMGILEDIAPSLPITLLIETQAFSLQKVNGRMTPADRDVLRASIIRERL